jgi:pimeloyl-ACP methyl ester carboxylesterase
MNKYVFSLLLLISVCAVNHLTAQPQKKTSVVLSNGISIAYESFGSTSSETILLIQGTGAQLIDWPDELCGRLAAKGYRVIRFDNRDVGLSTKLDSLGMPDWGKVIPNIGTCNESGLAYTIKDMAKDAIGLLDALNIEKAHIVGASMGGAIAHTLAFYYPNRIYSLTSIMASSGNPKLPQGNPEVRQVMATPPPVTDDMGIRTTYLARIYKVMGSPGYPAPDSVLSNMARKSIQRSWYPIGTARHAAAIIIADNCDRREMLKKITIPTVVIHGESDPVVSMEAGREVAASIPGAKLVTLPGMGHNLPTELIPKIVDGILLAAKNSKE